MHLVVIGVAGLLVGAGSLLDRRVCAANAAPIVILLTSTGIAVPLSADSAGPSRWIELGPLSLYVAPVLLPSLLAASSLFVHRRDVPAIITVAALVCVAALLALQPDASQALALLAATVVLLVCYRTGKLTLTVATIAMTLITAWAFAQPDPLEPVAHVEGVFALALSRSLPIGIAVIACAVALIASLAVRSLRGPLWLLSVAAYYAVLFGCSVAGLTPAPLIGFGAGPMLGFGLLTALSGWFDEIDSASRP